MMFVDKSLKKISKRVIYNIRLLDDFLNGNKLLSNPGKTQSTIFDPKTKVITKNLNLSISGQKLN